MNSRTDQQLLREYAERRSEVAFTELVRRHTDLVYSAAIRMVCDAHLAQDVAQGVFVALAQSARQLTDRTVLSGWLHRTAQNLASKTVRSDVRRRAREQEATAMNEMLANEPDASWDQLAPQLDAALGELNDTERDAVMLRYFERKSAQEMAKTLGVSEEAAQKRVGRGVEHLRESLAKRGLAVGAGGLVVAISANAVQAAPAGLAATLSTTALAGTTVAAAATHAAVATTTTSLSTMTTIKIGLIGAAAAAATLAAPLVIQHQSAAKLRAENEALNAQVAQLSQPPSPADTTDTTAPAAAVSPAGSDEQLKELARLRSEVTRLRQDSAELARRMASAAQGRPDAMAAELDSLLAKVNALKQRLEQQPKQKIPELEYLTPRDWFQVALDAKLDTDNGYRQALGRLRMAGKQGFAPTLRKALNGYVDANNGQLPSDLAQLQAYLGTEVNDAILSRYKLVRSGDAQVEPGQDPSVVAEKAAVDPGFDSLMSVGLNGMSMKGQGGGGGMGFSSRLANVIRRVDGTNEPGWVSGGFGGFGGGSGTGAVTGSVFYSDSFVSTNAAAAPR